MVRAVLNLNALILVSGVLDRLTGFLNVLACAFNGFTSGKRATEYENQCNASHFWSPLISVRIFSGALRSHLFEDFVERGACLVFRLAKLLLQNAFKLFAVAFGLFDLVFNQHLAQVLDLPASFPAAQAKVYDGDSYVEPVCVHTHAQRAARFAPDCAKTRG